METITITEANDVQILWTAKPEFEFGNDEVAALSTLQALNEELRTARLQLEHVMRYIKAAIPAAQAAGASPQAIINHVGVARQTVYDALDKPYPWRESNSRPSGS